MTPPLAYSPYDYGIHEDPYPTYARLRAEAPSSTTRSSTSGPRRATTTSLAAFRDVDHYSNAYGVSPRPGGLRARRPPGHVVPGPGPAAAHPHALLVRQELHAAPGGRAGGRSIRALAVAHLDAGARARATFDFIADFAGLLPMDVISELVGVPEAGPGRDPPPGRPAGAPRGRRVRRPAGGHGGRADPGRLLRRHGAQRPRGRHERDDLTSVAAAGRDRRRPADRRRDHRLPLPDGRGGQRDDDQAARQRLVLGLAQPGPAGQAARRPGPGAATGSRRRCATTPRRQMLRAGDRQPAAACTGVDDRRRAAACCCWSGRPTATRTSSPTPSATTSTGTRRTWSASAAAATSAWAPPWPGWRRGSR